ncbi:MAG: ACT domain-containing protein [Erysipelotrichaceae bacterium]|nr:ACT domain-containing protein [Erysipelotrichaceae bacterium]
MRAVISVVGNDRVGILAMVANACADHGINIMEVAQTIVDGIFSMTMIVDMKGMNESFEDFASEMEQIGMQNALIIRVMNQEIFDAMHSI